MAFDGGKIGLHNNIGPRLLGLHIVHEPYELLKILKNVTMILYLSTPSHSVPH